MPQTPHLPIFVQWIQAIGVLIIAIVGVWIAYHQMLTARVKLQHDLFDKRYAVYSALMRLLANVGQTGNATMKEILEFHIETKEADFLFQSEITSYFTVFISHLNQIMASEKIARIDNQSDELIDKHLTISHENMIWLMSQPDIIRDKFAPYLKIPMINHPAYFLIKLVRRVWSLARLYRKPGAKNSNIGLTQPRNR